MAASMPLANDAQPSESASAANLIDLDDGQPLQDEMQHLSIPSDSKQGKQTDTNDQSYEQELPPSYKTTSRGEHPLFRAVDHVKDNRIHFLIAATGSLAVRSLPVFLESFNESKDITIRVILDKVAVEHLSPEAIFDLPLVDGVYLDDDWQGHNPDLQYDLRTWLDYMLIVPCDQSTLAKMMGGITDDLITTILRIFDNEGKLNPRGTRGRYKYLSVAPAMDSATWAHPVTVEQIWYFEKRWISQRPFAKNVEWCRIVRPLSYKKADFDAFDDNCNMDMAQILMEARWQCDKFRKGHPWYVAGD